MSDILERLQARYPFSTHWEGCEESHDTCAAIHEIEQLRFEIAGLRSDIAWKSRRIERLEKGGTHEL